MQALHLASRRGAVECEQRAGGKRALQGFAHGAGSSLAVRLPPVPSPPYSHLGKEGGTFLSLCGLPPTRRQESPRACA